MKKKFTEEQIKKAIDQALANIEMEEVIICCKEKNQKNEKSKILLKEKSYGSRFR